MRTRKQNSNGNRQLMTINFLISTRNRIDKQIESLKQSQGSDMKVTPKQGKSPSGRKRYVSRVKNENTLEEAVLKALTPKRSKSTEQVIETIQKKGLYHTKSKLFYRMVNIKLNELNKEGQVSKTGRGEFKSMPDEAKIDRPKRKRGRPRKEETSDSLTESEQMIA